MVRASPATVSAASGELSTLMFARADYARFQNGLRKARGFMVLPEGAFTRLPGTKYLGETHQNRPARLMRFVFKDEDAVLLEWTDFLLRFWRNSSLVSQASTVDPYSINTPYSLSQARRLQSLMSSDRVYLAEGSAPPHRLSRFANDNWQIEPTPFENGPFAPRNLDEGKSLTVSGVTGAVSISASFNLFTQQHVGTQIQLFEVSTLSTPYWAADIDTVLNDQFYYNGNVYRVAGFDTSPTGKTGVNPPVHTEGVWLAEKRGPIYEFLSNGSGIVQITSVIGPQSATAVVVKRLPSGLAGTGTYRWAEQAWSARRGYPRAIGAYRQRHVYGGTTVEPRTLWHSVIGGTVDMSATGGDDEGFSYILDSDARRNGEITSIVGAGGVLHVGTTAGEFVGSSTDADRAYAEETANFDNDTDFGSGDVEPVVVAGKVIMLDKTGRRMLAMIIGQDGRFDGEPLTQIARHILSPQCVRMVYQSEPLPIIWALLSDGDLVGCTYILKQQVLGFHKHNLARGRVVDIEVMPSADGTSETLELVVAREVGSETRHFREQLQEPFVDLDGARAVKEDAWHLFAAVRYEGVPTTVISGLDHLEGEAVVAWTETGAYADLTVAGGQVVLPDQVRSAIVGLDGSADDVCETLDIRAGAADGGDEGRHKSHRATGLHLHRTAGGTISVVQIDEGEEVETTPEPVIPRQFNRDASLKSGVFDLAGHQGWAMQSYFRFRPEPGAPMTVLARTPTIMVSDD